MNKIAQYINHFRNLGSQAAMRKIAAGQTKQAAAISPRLRNVILGLGGGIGAGALYAANKEEPGMLESALEGGKDMLSNTSPEDLAGYGNLLRSLGEGGGSLAEYAAGQPSPMDYDLQDLGGDYAADPHASMGYSAPMSPEEEAAYYAYYNS
tara:strand:- start:1999 stop:2454 length:456 start_codon:yes stop_codon:yes gene_type:complete